MDVEMLSPQIIVLKYFGGLGLIQDIRMDCRLRMVFLFFAPWVFLQAGDINRQTKIDDIRQLVSLFDEDVVFFQVVMHDFVFDK
jgi:hypothetical protein